MAVRAAGVSGTGAPAAGPGAAPERTPRRPSGARLSALQMLPAAAAVAQKPPESDAITLRK